MTQPDAAGTTGDETETPRFDIHFHDDHVAPAPGGLYRLMLEHELSGDKVGSDKLPPVQQEFEIRTPQFTIDASFVHALHPAPAAVGAFDRLLPHITLDRLILPWERILKPDWTERPPWLALLLFAEEELPGDPKAQGRTDTRTVQQFLDTTDSDVLLPRIDLDDVPSELWDSTCTTIDVPAAVFKDLVPRRADLPFLCHVRKVRPWQPPEAAAASGETLEIGDYSVVVANRFPRTAGRYAAHLVSLEGFGDHLAGQQPARPVVRMVSLWAWSFEARPDPTGHFDALIRHMAEDPAGLGLRLRPRQPAGARTAATDRLDLGYAPVDYVLPSGEHTFGWYRGPFTPVVAPAVPRPAEGYRQADEALVYLTDTGVFDVSYAAAFTLGRSLALSDDTLAASLSAFRSRARHVAGRALMRTKTPLATAPGQAHERFHELIAGGLGHRLHAAATTPAAEARTGGATAPRLRAGGVPRPPGVEALEALLDRSRDDRARQGLRAALSAHLAPLISAVDQVKLLAATPLSHLVPDARMLPPESLRFFHVDPQWCTALRDGVLSTGIGTSLDAAVNRLAHEALEEPRPLTGLLMRSALVRNWPDVVVEPRVTGGNGEPQPLTVAHRVIIGPDLLLCLFDGVPDEVRFREPHEGIHFGVDEGERIGLRRLTEPVGKSLEEGGTFPPEGEEGITRFLRAVDGGEEPEILDLAAGADPLVPAMAVALRAAGQLGPDDDLSPGAFAVELVNAPQCITFSPSASAPAASAPSFDQPGRQ
ncbi:hypothetical protein [Streptomyces hiroshimensis]|uniref:Uncharacterized protein n=1 Tax=Streptomyces hiroshimensis TaxID=66424 RepID=A0ABQ2Y874_9ACTN|nr:hypothetical protein [Streptomyces hiroshimensis]GGX74390.1 hypothetical protein GCM10010324_19660 [Streptomyces hiroshimensis]